MFYSCLLTWLVIFCWKLNMHRIKGVERYTAASVKFYANLTGTWVMFSVYCSCRCRGFSFSVSFNVVVYISSLVLGLPKSCFLNRICMCSSFFSCNPHYNDIEALLIQSWGLGPETFYTFLIESQSFSGSVSLTYDFTDVLKLLFSLCG